jgi:uncharacterized membrane protein
MSVVTKQVEVDVPVQIAYNQWTQFEEFPRFMEGVEKVEQLDEERLQWVAEVGGKRKEWSARIVRQVPDSVIQWHSENGPYNSGTVRFRSAGDRQTEIELEMEYEPEGIVEDIGDALGFVSRQVESDLQRFKEFIESRGRETGGWRGEIPEGGEQRREFGATGQGGTNYGGTPGIGGAGSPALGGTSEEPPPAEPNRPQQV